MTMISTDFEKAYKQLDRSRNPGWLKTIQSDGFDYFHAEGFPTRKNEEWKYTNLKPIQENSFHLPESNGQANLRLYEDFLNDMQLELVFVDGLFSPEHSSLENLPQGLTLCPLHQVIAEDHELLKEILSRKWDDADNTFTGLNNAFLRDGAFVHLAENTRCRPLIHLVYIYTDQKPAIMVFPRNIIQIDAASQASVMESHICRSHTTRYFNNNQTDIVIERNARLGYFKAQADSLNAFDISNTRVYQATDSRLKTFSLTTGGSLVRNNLAICLDGENIESSLDGLYGIRGHQHIDNHTCVDHRYPHCTSSQLYKGILDGSARAVFNGKIFVRREAQKTNAYQLNRNLMLSPDAEVDTKPQLEIYADDVKCTHGATIGQIDEDEIFYLQSRCIPKKQAISLLSHGFAEDVLYQIGNPGIRHTFRGLLCEYFLDAKMRKSQS